ncbi:MAG: CRISPR-associated endonuclease Cas2 [Parcubacteria group bacterium]|nr:CRISPR-associated endonuclease Cas2 [Parcubacteria group bacterium]
METKNRVFEKTGSTQKEIIKTLFAGATFSIAGSIEKDFGIVKIISDKLNQIKENSLRRAIKSLYRSRLVEALENENGSMTVVLTENGKRKALTYNMDTMTVKKPEKWDGRWRLVMFDIPNKRKKEREVLRSLLKQLGFVKYQESAFIIPYECKNEIDYVVEFFNLRPHVRFLEVASFDDDLIFKKNFNLI